MKVRTLTFLFIAVFGFLAIGTSAANSEPVKRKIFLFDKAHRDLLGAPLDSDLLKAIQPEGRLGTRVFTPIKKPRVWLIDASLIEDVQSLALKEITAREWLDKLKRVSSNDTVLAIPYGHPDKVTTQRLIPSELKFYFLSSKSRLQNFLKRNVAIDPKVVWTMQRPTITMETINSYKENRKAISILRTVVPVGQLDEIRSRMALLLASDITNDQQLFFSQIAAVSVAQQNHKLRIIPGKYRLSSEHEKVPVTLVNDFSAPVKVSLQLTPLNSRIQVENVADISIPANSKLQLSIPVTVIASGTTAVLAQFTNQRGTLILDSAMLTLNLSVISPAVAWFTSAAGIMLFLAALTQTIRRVRRSRK